jgi:hypothetical protein
VPPAFRERSAIYFNPQPSDDTAYAYKDPGAPENYCWLLAGEIRARAECLGLPIDPPENQEKMQACPTDQAKSFLYSLSCALPNSLAGLAVSYDPAKLDQKRLCDLLFGAPHAQARLAAIVEYTPSKWLVQQEITALGLWPGQRHGNDPRDPKEPYLSLALRHAGAPAPLAAFSTERPASEVKPADVAQSITQLPPGAENPPPKPPPDAYQVAAELRLSGMCFSGGGIRSATFNLGVLQGLAAHGKLGCFDYLSTVSGGGYIHQFLASWIACENLAKVQEQLTPIPGAQHRALWPDPLRWLRRYSNYLTPQKGFFSADTWVVGAIWLRNTLLNQIVLVSTLLLLLLLPHLRITPADRIAHFVLSFWGEVASAALILLFCGYAAWSIGSRIVAIPDPSGSATPDVAPRESMRQWKVLLCVLAPIILASFLISPYLYRSAFWNPIPRQSGENLKRAASSTPLGASARSLCGLLPSSAEIAQPVPAACAMVTPNNDLGPDSTQRIITASRHLAPSTEAPEAGNFCGNPSNCTASSAHPATALQPTPLDNLRIWQSTFSFPWWNPRKSAISLVFLALLAGICMLVCSVWVTITEEQHRLPTTKALFAFIVVAAAAFGYLFIHLIRIAIFYAAFFLPQSLVTRCGIVFVPPGALAIVLICLNLGVGLVGHLMENASREWLARLRAWSYIASFAWISLAGASLLGNWIVATIFGLAYIKHVAIFGWIGTTVASLLAGKSPRTGGSNKDDSSAPSPFSPLSILTAIGPPVFMIGLILLLSYVVEQTITALQTQRWTAAHSFIPYVFLFGALAAIALFFGWRVDINDFSLHSFYRDRLARCYAGASNPDRSADRFTGFSASDNRLRLVDLLPASFSNLDIIDLWKPPLKGSKEESASKNLQDARKAARKAEAAAEKAANESAAAVGKPGAAAKMKSEAQKAEAEVSIARKEVEAAAQERLACYRKSDYFKSWYGGPFPIFCTSLNLSFGEDLAYQERKAAAFVFTPLFCGYDVGWTDGKSQRIQFNGFTPTCDFAYPDGGPHMATAVAASGAAISPNWGFHTNPAMAFLLTMFNVRLGWWIRNPRHRDFKYSQFLRDHQGIAQYIDENPASPRFAISYLIAELLGLVNDESAYVYLTDGGHFENMGLYELVRRRCMKILISDAEEDHRFVFEGIGMAIRKCRIDFGVEINLDLDVLKRNKNLDSPVHFVIGSIQYPEVEELGSILYIKSTLSSGLPADLVNYRRQYPSFPHDTTLDQWFTESKFESYRRLGHFSIQPDATTSAADATMAKSTEIDRWLDSLDPHA